MQCYIFSPLYNVSKVTPENSKHITLVFYMLIHVGCKPYTIKQKGRTF